jgi:CheY-like chemotaxis protein
VVPSSAWVRSDPILLERVLLNLVSNAIRYTSVGGVVVGCRRHGETVRVEVCDTGPGIPADQRQNIFGEFYRLAGRNTHGGLGLGLAIVDRLCGLLGHRIELASTVGKGSRFSITVPLAIAQFTSAEAHDTVDVQGTPPIVADVSSGKLVVVIDDDPLVLDGMCGVLRNWGYRVVAAPSPDAILAELGDHDLPDLIISDYRLADGHSGIRAIDDLRASLAAPIPAFLISGDTAPERLREAQESGHHLLHKPVGPMKLRAMVSQLLKTLPVAGAA